MDKITVENVVKAVKGKFEKGNGSDWIDGVKHDSRECGPGDMFVAIAGENHDGHAYIKNVLDAGCRTVLVSHRDGWYDEVASQDFNMIEVEDTVYAMGELAAYYLDTLDLLKIAVTGSVGKTSTRDMIYYVMNSRYPCGRNMKNFNNDIGLPLSVFTFDSSMKAAVLEMGMDKKGEIDRLAQIVRPHIAVITNIGVSHMENFESRDGIFHAKMEIAGHITEYRGRKGALIFPYDGRYLTRENTRGDYRQIMIGEDGRSDYIISAIDDFGLKGVQFNVECREESTRVEIPVPGRHNAVNGTLAIAAGNLAGVGTEEACRGLLKAELTGSRLKPLTDGRLSVIDDTYNASPASVKSAMKVLEKSSCEGMRTAVLGDMYELGDQSERQHYEVGLFARGLDIDRLIAVGELAEHIARGASGGRLEVEYFRTKEELYPQLERLAAPGDIILVKGSRGMKMEKIVERILKKQEMQ